MGYTHYFGIDKVTAKNKKQYGAAIKKCHKVIQTISKLEGGLSGYSAHTKLSEYKGIKLNGSERTGMCEDFVLPESLVSFSEFCKTRQLHYDKVVVACLIILSNDVDGFKFHSDGDVSCMLEALTIAQLVTGKAYEIPKSIRPSTRPNIRLA